MTQKTHLVNMFIIATAIVIICAARSKFSELFVAEVPMIPQYDGYGAQGGPTQPIQGGYPNGNPMIYQNQIYPARIPYYNEMGRQCNSIKDCGSMGVCTNGSCKTVPYENTVFNIPTH